MVVFTPLQVPCRATAFVIAGGNCKYLTLFLNIRAGRMEVSLEY